MAALAAFEARAGDGERSVIADIDRMRAIRRADAEARKARLVDDDPSARILGRENALLAVAEQAVEHAEIAPFQPDAGAVLIGHADILEDQPLDPCAAAAQHQRRLAFAHTAVEDRGARGGGAIGDVARLLHRAIAPDAGCDLDRAGAAADLVHGIGQRAIGLAGLGDAIGHGTLLLREKGQGTDQGQRGDKDDAKRGHAQCHTMLAGKCRILEG